MMIKICKQVYEALSDAGNSFALQRAKYSKQTLKIFNPDVIKHVIVAENA